MVDQNFADEPNRLVSGIGTSVIRTLVPVVVGTLLAAAAKAGFDIDEGLATEIVATVFITLYYAGVRWLEVNVAPKWGWLLGVAKAPEYKGPDTNYEP
jgi:hypothetical protein